MPRNLNGVAVKNRNYTQEGALKNTYQLYISQYFFDRISTFIIHVNVPVIRRICNMLDEFFRRKKFTGH